MRFAGRTAPESGSFSTGQLSRDRWPARIADRNDTLSCALRPAMSLGRAVSPARNIAGLPTVVAEVVGVWRAETSPPSVEVRGVAAPARGFSPQAAINAALAMSPGKRKKRVFKGAAL